MNKNERNSELYLLRRANAAQDSVLAALQEKLDAARARTLSLVKLCYDFRDGHWIQRDDDVYRVSADTVYDFDVALLKLTTNRIFE